MRRPSSTTASPDRAALVREERRAVIAIAALRDIYGPSMPRPAALGIACREPDCARFPVTRTGYCSAHAAPSSATTLSAVHRYIDLLDEWSAA